LSWRKNKRPGETPGRFSNPKNQAAAAALGSAPGVSLGVFERGVACDGLGGRGA